MATTIDWATYVINVPQSDLTFLSGVRFELDVDVFRLGLKDIEDSPDGMGQLKTHNHQAESVLAGVTYARQVEILAPYTVEFEDGQYEVNCVGANHNISDRKFPNQTSLIINNAAGLIVVVSGSGLDAGQDTKLTEIHGELRSIEGGEHHSWIMRILLSAMAGLLSGAATTNVKMRDQADSKDRIDATVDSAGNRTSVTLDGDV